MIIDKHVQPHFEQAEIDWIQALGHEALRLAYTMGRINVSNAIRLGLSDSEIEKIVMGAHETYDRILQLLNELENGGVDAISEDPQWLEQDAYKRTIDDFRMTA